MGVGGSLENFKNRYMIDSAKSGNKEGGGERMAFAGRTEAERREAARQAGIKSGEVRRAQRSWKESVEMMMRGRLNLEEAEQVREALGLDAPAAELTQQDKIVAAVSRKAAAGDKDCAAFLRDTAGQSPAQLVKIGNIDDKPFETLDLSSLSDDDLRRLAEREKAGAEEAGAAEV